MGVRTLATSYICREAFSKSADAFGGAMVFDSNGNLLNLFPIDHEGILYVDQPSMKCQLKLINERYSSRRESRKAGWAEEKSYQRKAATINRIISDYSVPAGARVLELGCGAGNTVFHMIEKGFDAYGVDISDQAIDWAKDIARRRNVSAHFNVANITDLKPFQDNFFDVIFDGDCLWMILGADRAACFSSVFRKLKSGGILYAQAHLVKVGFASTAISLRADISIR